MVFTGDALLIRKCGRTDFQQGICYWHLTMLQANVILDYWVRDKWIGVRVRAPIEAIWTDRFSRCCWQRFSRFLVCTLTLPQCLPVTVYHLCYCSTLSLLPSHSEQGGAVVGHWVNKGRAKPLKLQQVIILICNLLKLSFHSFFFCKYSMIWERSVYTVVGDPAKLYKMVHEKLFTLPDHFIVYPAHDYSGIVWCIYTTVQ